MFKPVPTLLYQFVKYVKRVHVICLPQVLHQISDVITILPWWIIKWMFQNKINCNCKIERFSNLTTRLWYRTFLVDKICCVSIQLWHSPHSFQMLCTLKLQVIWNFSYISLTIWRIFLVQDLSQTIFSFIYVVNFALCYLHCWMWHSLMFIMIRILSWGCCLPWNCEIN